METNAEKINLNTVTKLLLNELKSRLPIHFRVEIYEPGGILESNLDPDALIMMLKDLFDNTAKYCNGAAGMIVDASRGGEISIYSDCEPLSGNDLLTSLRDMCANRIWLTVRVCDCQLCSLFASKLALLWQSNPRWLVVNVRLLRIWHCQRISTIMRSLEQEIEALFG